MNLFKYDPNCYKCNNEGWVVGKSFSDLVTCPICKGSRLTRILKDFAYKANLKLFGLFYDAFETINWVSQDILDFSRLHNTAIKIRVAKTIIVDYASGYAVDGEKVRLAFDALQAAQLLPLAEKSHIAAFTSHEISSEFLDAFNKQIKQLVV